MAIGVAMIVHLCRPGAQGALLGELTTPLTIEGPTGDYLRLLTSCHNTNYNLLLTASDSTESDVATRIGSIGTLFGVLPGSLEQVTRVPESQLYHKMLDARLAP